MSQPGFYDRPENIESLTVVVVGAGLMGHSIAGVFAAAGAAVTVYDPSDAALKVVHERVRAQLSSLGRDTAAAGRIRLASSLEDAVTGADLAIEAVPEILELKQNLFSNLGALLPRAVLATNTSVFKISDVARETVDPQRVVGTHWFNPPHLVPLVEVVHGESTAADTAHWIFDILTAAGKIPVHVRRDIPGFIGNRLQHAMWREAISMVEEGVCDAETVDLVARNSFGLRLAVMGPLENADYVGLDLAAAVHNYLFPTLNNDDHASPLLSKLIGEGHLGAKTGSGLLSWTPESRRAAAERLERHLIAATATTHP
ncbi:3-hydroxyacyl-CoA dehydrogenase NAD-binding domain-containing protein [Rhodococcus sp. B10]|uniref:3-hydroxyacyl-CoA dehydrogenase family protein n=1 Tax=Rhodococcus sp. B10 TaxID=2695876 RepID=UPI00142F5EB6|nr:3-hydroxyacyl-CoA dehydrogenase NAD-binding domain-containing protein [Rhodococcus sp. B10]NIL78348.1 putative 3-hydroxybutyryl-CoA dehydrogenase [Rhodococcus sp. B10]